MLYLLSELDSLLVCNCFGDLFLDCHACSIPRIRGLPYLWLAPSFLPLFSAISTNVKNLTVLQDVAAGLVQHCVKFFLVDDKLVFVVVDVALILKFFKLNGDGFA